MLFSIYYKVTSGLTERDSPHNYESEVNLMKNFTKRLISSAMTATMALSMVGGLNVSAATDDHGNSMSSATSFTTSVSGTIDYSGDIDYFRYTATTSGIRYFTTVGNDSIITVYNSSGTSIGSSMSTVGTSKMAGCNLTKGSTYYISVRENGSNYGTKYTLSSTVTKLSVTHLCQVDSSWRNVVMQGNPSSGETIGSSGCAITSCAMVINYLKNKNTTPLTFNSSTYLDSSNGAKWDKIASSYFLTDSGYFTSESTAISYLQRGYPVILHLASGHFLVAVGYENGKFMVTDAGKSSSDVVPWNTNYPNGVLDKYRVFS